jgi:hypothetical protein
MQVTSNQCATCDGSGEVLNRYYDSELHMWLDDGTNPCPDCMLVWPDEQGDADDK